MLVGPGTANPLNPGIELLPADRNRLMGRSGGASGVDRKPCVDQVDTSIDRRMRNADLHADGLDQPVDALDQRRAFGERARDRGWPRELLRRGGIFLEW